MAAIAGPPLAAPPTPSALDPDNGAPAAKDNTAAAQNQGEEKKQKACSILFLSLIYLAAWLPGIKKSNLINVVAARGPSVVVWGRAGEGLREAATATVTRVQKSNSSKTRWRRHDVKIHRRKKTSSDLV